MMKLAMGKFAVAVLFGTLVLTGSVNAQEKTILVQSTTSTANSGLYDFLLPMFEKESGIKVNVVAVGTGQAITNAERCDADVLLVHAKAAEEKFVSDGFGVKRFDLMYNDFVVVGPKSDPAGIAGLKDAKAAFQKIAETKSLFASRGDDSGTHKKELSLWKAAGIEPAGEWYRSTGSGMGATLNTGIGMEAYVLTDRATWISFGNKADYSVEVEGDQAMFNQYGVILIDSKKCPTVRSAEGQEFIDWLISTEGQNAIASFQIDGKQLFFPNAQ